MWTNVAANQNRLRTRTARTAVAKVLPRTLLGETFDRSVVLYFGRLWAGMHLRLKSRARMPEKTKTQVTHCLHCTSSQHAGSKAPARLCRPTVA